MAKNTGDRALTNTESPCDVFKHDAAIKYANLSHLILRQFGVAVPNSNPAMSPLTTLVDHIVKVVFESTQE